MIDRRMQAAVRKIRELGYTHDEGQSANATEGVAQLTKVADAMHALLVKRSDELEGCIEGSPEEAEFASIADALEAYEELRWPLGKEPGGKG